MNKPELKMWDKVRVIKDIDLPKYPKTATMLIERSKERIGKVFIINQMRDKKEKYRYGIYDPTLIYCAREELELVKRAKVKVLGKNVKMSNGCLMSITY